MTLSSRTPNFTIDLTSASRCSAAAGHRARWADERRPHLGSGATADGPERLHHGTRCSHDANRPGMTGEATIAATLRSGPPIATTPAHGR